MKLYLSIIDCILDVDCSPGQQRDVASTKAGTEKDATQSYCYHENFMLKGNSLAKEKHKPGLGTYNKHVNAAF